MNKIITSRRSFVTGLAALFAAPAIVRSSSLMPVKQMLPELPGLPTNNATCLFQIGYKYYYFDQRAVFVNDGAGLVDLSSIYNLKDFGVVRL